MRIDTTRRKVYLRPKRPSMRQMYGPTPWWKLIALSVAIGLVCLLVAMVMRPNRLGAVPSTYCRGKHSCHTTTTKPRPTTTTTKRPSTTTTAPSVSTTVPSTTAPTTVPSTAPPLPSTTVPPVVGPSTTLPPSTSTSLTPSTTVPTTIEIGTPSSEVRPTSTTTTTTPGVDPTNVSVRSATSSELPATGDRPFPWVVMAVALIVAGLVIVAVALALHKRDEVIR